MVRFFLLFIYLVFDELILVNANRTRNCFFLMALACLDAAVLRVPKDHNSIQEAINVAAPGDRIEVEQGVYYESITLKKM